MMEESPFTFRVIDLKQSAYCPRILYYQTILPDIRPVTFKMEAGIAAHRQAAGREKRRSLRAYGLADGRRAFNVPVYNPALLLSGEVDMVIETANELIPVDYKQAKRVGGHHKLQLMAYGRLLELADPKNEKPVRRGFLYLLPARKAVEIRFTAHLRRRLDGALTLMKQILKQQQFPAAAARPGQCVDCEFRRFCRDTL